MEAEYSAISKVFNVLSKISSFYHTSSIRAAELQKIADSNNLETIRKPKIFKVRWMQYTHRLMHAILVSWNAIVLHLEKIKADERAANKKKTDKEAAGYLTYLKNLDNLKMIAFLADLLLIFKRMQKKLQYNSLTLISMNTHVKAAIVCLEKVKKEFIPSGYEDTLRESVVTKENGKFLKGIQLHEEEPCGTRRNKLDLKVFRKEVCDSLIEFLTIRLEIGSSM